MSVLFRTETVRGTSSNFGDGKTYPVDAHFEVQLHEGPPDPKTWEGGGQTVAYWREQFKGLKDPTRWTVPCDAKGVEDAVIPNEVIDALPDDTRVSLMWIVCRV